MKHSTNCTLADFSARRLVRFEFEHSTAERVCIAGTFNDWRPSVTAMIPLRNGRWLKQLVLPPGTYQYCLVVDGQWGPDPRVKEIVPTRFSGRTSVLTVSDPQPSSKTTVLSGSVAG